MANSLDHDYRAGSILEEQARSAIPTKGWLRGYVRWAENSVDANLAYHLVAGLAVLTQSVSISYSVPFGAIQIYTPIFGLLVGDSTDSRKTTSIALAQKIQRLAFPDREGAAFGSAEAIVDELKDKDQQIVYFPEYSSFLAQAERGYGNAMKTKLTEVYDCGIIARRKANGKGVTVPTPRLTLLCGIAPGYIERHTEPIDWSEGYLARHFTILANRERYVENPGYDRALEQRLVAWLVEVREIATAVRAYDLNSPTPTIAPCEGLTPAAAHVRAEWQKQVAKAAHSVRQTVAPGIGRASGMLFKTAALLAWDWGVSRQGAAWYIDDEIMLAATKIVNLHVQSVLAIGEWLAPDRAMRDRRKVLALINAKPIRRGAILRQAQMTKRDCGAIVETLLEEGTIAVHSVHSGEPYYVLVENPRGAHLVEAPEGDGFSPPAPTTDPSLFD